MSPPLRLVTEPDEFADELTLAATGSLREQLLCTAVLQLLRDVTQLKKQVKELQHCQSA